MFAMTLKSTLALFVSAAAVVSALPAKTRDVFDPTILTPNAETIWQAGSIQNVTWDTSNAPSDISNGALIVLAKGGKEDFEHPLASNFSLLAGTQEITVPLVVPGDDYEIVLFGDSGNISPDFKITIY